MIQVWCLDVTLLEQDNTLTPISSSNFIPSISLSAIQDSFNYTVLHKAIYRKLYDIAEFLLEKGASTELKDLDRYTPFQLVIHEGYTEMVKLLIIYGADH
ncbi:ankyrin repeat domain-containing protein [Rickettsia gravesii]|uniref:ankyrin repeat domain-containing protein n=1 Tax=Rickettsia gravesii TaxID=354585 RepID=UPI0004B03D19|nr:ankyrin repeat domain-containing protein [Rickettsia gravesii]